MRRLLNKILGLLGLRLVRSAALDDLGSGTNAFGDAPHRHPRERVDYPTPIGEEASPPGSAEISPSTLAKANTRLEELRKAISQADSRAGTPSQWTEEYINADLDLARFRSDNAFVWQQRDGNLAVHHVLTHHYLRSIDTLGLFDVLEEDGAFGCETFLGVGGARISRDLLDSVSEILFLERVLGISTIDNLCLIDIGAGYGRLAHRMVEALPNLDTFLCADAVAESTFLAEYYLGYRGVADKARAVALDQISNELARAKPHCAVNIHSFSECPMAAIEWWLDLVVEHDIEHLLIVPNHEDHEGTRLQSTEPDDTRIDLLPVLSERGFSLAVDEPKYLDPATQRFGVSPTRRYLFTRKPT